MSRLNIGVTAAIVVSASCQSPTASFTTDDLANAPILSVDLAVGKTATQSSTPPWGVPAGRAVDGNIDGDWNHGSVTHTDLDAQAWWQVDLGGVTAIGEVVLYNRTDGLGDRLSNFDILLSNDGITWWIAASFGGPAPARTALSIQASGRFVKVRLRGTNYLSLAEVQVFAGPLCGNGIVELGEQCDDGNLRNFDRCSDDCQNACPIGQIWCDCTIPACVTQAQCDTACSL